MAASVKSQEDPRFPDRLIEAAVRLYGRHGLEGVSLRRISQEAGNGNNNAVQYHFGSLDGLIRAILTKYTPMLEFERARRLAALRSDGAPPTLDLVDILARPVLDLVDENGERAFARFMLSLVSTPAGARHLVTFQNLLPISDQIIRMIGEGAPTIPPELLRERLRLVGIMILVSVFNRLEPYNTQDVLDDALIDHAIRIAAAAVVDPLAPAMRGRLEGYRANPEIRPDA